MLRSIVTMAVSLFIAGSLSSVLTPPSSSLSQSSSENQDFFPLAVDNTWTHEVTFSGGDYHYYMTETVILDDFPLLEGAWFVVAEEYEPLTDTAPEAKSTVAYLLKEGFLLRYPWLDSEGDKVWDTNLGEGIERILPRPYTGERSWEIGFQTNAWPIEGGQNVTASARAWIDRVAIQVPAGTFHNCLRVETMTISTVVDPRHKTTKFHLHFTEWYARGVGLIKAISNEGEGTPVKSVTELLSYTVQ